MKKKLIIVASVLFMGILFAVGAYVVKSSKVESISSQANAKDEPFVRGYSLVLGNPDAKVTLVEFFDPACEACRWIHPHVKQILAKYPNKLKLVLRYAPFHKGADFYVKVLEASRKQGKYSQTLERLYSSQHHWASNHHAKAELAWGVLKYTTLDLEQLKKDIELPEMDAIVKQDMEDVRALNISKTPSFFVNHKPLLSFGVSQLQDLIEAEIKAQYPN